MAASPMRCAARYRRSRGFRSPTGWPISAASEAGSTAGCCASTPPVATGRNRQRAWVSASPANASVATSNPHGPSGAATSGASVVQPASARQAAASDRRSGRFIDRAVASGAVIRPDCRPSPTYLPEAVLVAATRGL